MTNEAALPAAELSRMEIAATRRRLQAHVHRASTLAAPSRLAATGAEAVRTAVTNKAWDALHQVASVASTTSRKPGVVSMAAAGAASLTLLLLRRRRARRAGKPIPVPQRMRPRASWLGLALSIATVLLRRRW